VASCLSRPEEPITFRRCRLWALDWWGDTAAAYIRVENQAMPDVPDAVLEDCTLVSPQCALKVSNYGFHTYTRVGLRRCRLVVLNFSQPVGTPSDGIIVSMQEGKLLHAELEDCTLMGYKVFGVKVQPETVGDIRYTTRGDVRAYVQYQQDLPPGFHRLGAWPVDVFEQLTPPSPQPEPLFTDEQLVHEDMCELSPFLWQGRLCHMACVRPATGGGREDYYLRLTDAATGEELGRLGEGYGLGSILVHDGAAYVFASRWEPDGWHEVTVFRSRDLTHWESRLAIQGENEQLFNTSVCRGRNGFVMAYESNDPAYPAFTIKFAESKDLGNWRKLPDAVFGTDRYTACPCLRYVGGWYYMLYLEQRTPRWHFETYLARSRDLRHWELSAANPVLAPHGLGDGINASDPEIVEVDGCTWVYYAVGDQLSWMDLKRAAYPGSLRRFFESWFAQPGIPDTGTLAARTAEP
jgi:hypothetical protein